MLKSVFKEITIILLLILAIIILLAVLFYEYIPNNKTVPEKVESYTLADDVKVELEKELNNANSEEIIKTYQLDAIDLEHYEKTKEYNKGKVNPFSDYNTGNASSGTSNGSGNNQTDSNSSGNSGNNGGSASSSSSGNTNQNNNTNGDTNSSTNNNNGSTGTFLNTVGK